ncbi:hypothetical protein ALC62_10313, partial [Cyphomyrmex costatus]
KQLDGTRSEEATSRVVHLKFSVRCTMASSLGGPGMTTGVPPPRIVNLEFPPPPPYPPPHNQISCNALMEPVSPVVSPITSSRQRLLDYSYAYYQSDPGRFHTTYPTEVLSQQQQQQEQQQQQQQQQLRQQQQLQQIRSDPLKRHTYTTCYGTEENIYEEISEIRNNKKTNFFPTSITDEFFSKQCHRALHGSRRSLVAEEVRRVQSRHRRVLGELNLSVEAMLMPTTVDNNEEEMAQEAHGTSTEELLPSVSPADDLLSRVGGDMDSGFSGSSTASYSSASKSIFQSYLNSIHRSGLGSLRRGIGRTNGPVEPMGVLRKTKAAMIWKKGWKGWKKLHSFGSSSSSNSSNNKIADTKRHMVAEAFNGNPSHWSSPLSRSRRFVNMIIVPGSRLQTARGYELLAHEQSVTNSQCVVRCAARIQTHGVFLEARFLEGRMERARGDFFFLILH